MKKTLLSSKNSSPQRICILAMEAWGGMAQHPYTLLRALELIPGLEIYFIGLRSHETEKIYQESLFKSGRVKIFFLKYETDLKKKIRRLLFYVYNPFYFAGVSRLIKKIDPDLIHYSTGCIIEIFTAAFFNVNTRAKILSFHDPLPHDESNLSFLKRINNLIYAMIKKYALRKIPYIHVNAKAHIREIVSRFNISESRIFPTHMVSNIVDDFSHDQISPAELTNLKNHIFPKILFWGRIRAYKGVEFLVEAVRILLESNYRLQLILAGEGNIYFDYKDIENNLILINRYIENTEVEKIFTSTDLVVLPYVSASQSGIISLAYFYGKPVIATTVGGIPELIAEGETGFLVRPKDSNALAEKIRYFLDHPDKIIEMGREAEKYYQAFYSFEALSKELFDIYTKINHSSGYLGALPL